jgi:hypothetical protein
MAQDSDEFWRASPDMPSEAPPDWVNRDYSEHEEQPKSRRWMVWTVMILTAFFAFGGLWSTLQPLFK